MNKKNNMILMMILCVVFCLTSISFVSAENLFSAGESVTSENGFFTSDEEQSVEVMEESIEITEVPTDEISGITSDAAQEETDFYAGESEKTFALVDTSDLNEVKYDLTVGSGGGYWIQTYDLLVLRFIAEEDGYYNVSVYADNGPAYYRLESASGEIYAEEDGKESYEKTIQLNKGEEYYIKGRIYKASSKQFLNVYVSYQGLTGINPNLQIANPHEIHYIEDQSDIALEVEVTADTEVALVYKWRIYDADTETYKDVYESESNTYLLEKVSTYEKYQCEVTDTKTNLSRYAYYEIFIDTGFENHLGSSGGTGFPGEQITLRTEATVNEGFELFYQWYELIDETDELIPIKGANESTLTLTVKEGYHDYFCYITDGKGVTKDTCYLVSGYKVSGECGENVSWKYDWKTGILTMEGTGETFNFPSKPWAEYSRKIKQAVIGEGITYLGAEAFAYAAGLEKVILPRSMDSIGTDCFYDCPESMIIEGYPGKGMKDYAKKNRFTFVPRSLDKLDAPKRRSIQTQNGGIKLLWHEVEDAEGYLVYRKVKGGDWKQLKYVGAVTYYTDTGVTPGIEYEYTVKGYYTYNGEKHLGKCYSTGLSTVAKTAAPKLVSAEAVNGGIKFTWQETAGAEGYQVYRKTENGTWTFLKEVPAGTKSYTDTTAVAAKKYEYTVKGYCKYNGSKLVGYCYSTGKSAVARAKAPKLVSAEAVNGGIKFTWEKASGADGYLIYRKTNKGAWEQLKFVTAGTKSYTDTTVKAGTSYSYTIKSYNIYTNGKKLLGFCYSNGKSAVARAKAPKLTGVETVSDNFVKVKWQAIAGVDGYRVYRKTGNGNWVTVKDVAASVTEYVDQTVKLDTNYSYTVKAYNIYTNGKKLLGFCYSSGIKIKTESANSDLYIEGLSVEQVMTYFNEVCLDSEFSTGDYSHLIQKWTQPIYYSIYGDATETDRKKVKEMAGALNEIEGFPGMYEDTVNDVVNLEIYFCGAEELVEKMGSNFSVYDYGAVTFWYTDNEITDGIICCRSDISQTTRNSVIQEEIYNGLGPVQDTVLRTDSIIYQYSDDAQKMTDVDELIMKLLYHPDIKCGMNAAECEKVIRELYY